MAEATILMLEDALWYMTLGRERIPGPVVEAMLEAERKAIAEADGNH